MSNAAVEGQGGNVQPPNSGHPAWQEYLADVPPALQPTVQAAFQKWDANVQQRLQEVHTQYAPLKVYQPLADNKIPLQYIGQALQFAQELENNPKELFNSMNTKLDLGFVSAEEAQRQAPATDDPFSDFGETDITQHPQFKTLMETVNKMQQTFEEQQSQQAEEEEVTQFEAYLDSLVAGTPLENNTDAKVMITAFMSNSDMDGAAALTKVQGMLVQGLTNQATTEEQQTSTEPNPLMDAINAHLGGPVQNTPVGHVPQAESQAPVVMGNAGNAGSGVPSNPIDFGAMKTDDINSMVAQALEQASKS